MKQILVEKDQRKIEFEVRKLWVWLIWECGLSIGVYGSKIHARNQGSYKKQSPFKISIQA